MANLKSSKKDVRRTKTRTLRNKVFKDNMKSAVKNFKRLSEATKDDVAGLYKALDKAVKKGIIKKGAASRQKSKLMKKATLK